MARLRDAILTLDDSNAREYLLLAWSEAIEYYSMFVSYQAGSGKTRVLVHRIAWLIRAEGFSPWSILAVTFTNKAAREMRSRIEDMLQIPTHGMWVGTFHGLAHRLLKAHWKEAGLPQNFQILDSDDQLRLVKRVCRELELDEGRWPPKQAQWYINAQKDEGLRPQNIQPAGDLYLSTMVRIYEAYEQACNRAGAVDFAELLLRSLELWRDNPALREQYRARFGYGVQEGFLARCDERHFLRIHRVMLAVVDDDADILHGIPGDRLARRRGPRRGGRCFRHGLGRYFGCGALPYRPGRAARGRGAGVGWPRDPRRCRCARRAHLVLDSHVRCVQLRTGRCRADEVRGP